MVIGKYFLSGGLGVFFLIFFSAIVNAQERIVHFKIINEQQNAISSATVTIGASMDSLNKQMGVTDSSGHIDFRLTNGNYVINVTSVNYKPMIKNVRVSANDTTYVLKMIIANKTLKGVIVTSNRPLMRQQDDKTIVDPEPLAASSTNAYEILEKTPGIYVDQDGNIYLNSTTPATVYINGREQKMSAADIATMLKNLPPNAIASIEILRTPSARYDASGTGGIVNIVLKKGVRIGLTGSITSGINQGKYGNQFIGINLNNNNGNLNSYVNLQFSRRNSFDEIKTDRLFTSDTILSQDALTKYPTNSYYLGYGINYSFNKKWEFSYDGRLSYSNSQNSSTNLSSIHNMSLSKVYSQNEALVQNKSNNLNLNQGLNLKQKLDSLGSEWSTDFSFLYSPNTTDQNFTTLFFFPASPQINGMGNLKNQLYFFTGQTNLIKKLQHSITLETGLKASKEWFNNNTNYAENYGTGLKKDTIRSGHYIYNENINAGYIQASKNISGIVLKTGIRLENTNMVGHQVFPKDTAFSIHRTDLFPYVYLSRNLMKIEGYPLKGYLIYRRTITRPVYDYLNPSPRFIDPYLFDVGNPSLRPQFTQNYEANISVDERPIFALGVNNTNDIFTQVLYPVDSSQKVSMRTYDNLGNNKEFYFRGLGALPPGKRYFLVAGFQYNHNFYQGQYQNKPLLFKRGTWTIFSYQTFKITPLTQLTLNGFIRFNGQLQFYELTNFGSLNLSIAQQFLQKKLIITLSANDLLYTNNNYFALNEGLEHATGFRKSDTRRFGINMRYNFGIRKKDENNLLNLESPEKSQ